MTAAPRSSRNRHLTRGAHSYAHPMPTPAADDDPVLISVAAYSEVADQYEQTHAPKMADRADRFARSLSVPSTILDCGCGPGRDLARFVSHGHVARGIDLNPRFVAMANRQAPTDLCDLRDVATHLAGCFDGIWAAASLVHLDAADTSNVLHQFAELLRPDGRLYVCVNTTGTTGWLDEPDGRRWYTIWDRDAFVDEVEAAGFTIDDVTHDVFVEVWARRES